MKTSSIVSLVAVVVVVLGGAYWFVQRGPSVATPNYRPVTTTVPTQPSSATQTSPAQTSSSTSQVTAQHVGTSSAATTPKPQNFSVQASDTKANLTTITVAKGTLVAITFSVDANNTYHGGLDFRSSVVNTGTILSGKSKTISFTAATSFVFTPYWPSTNTKKPYTISVVVK